MTRWSEAELQVLRTVYVQRGLKAAAIELPARAERSIYIMASRMGLRTEHRPCPRGKMRSSAAEALRLRRQGFSYSAISRQLGMCEATATNAVLVAECLEAGHRPIERDHNRKILAAGRERLRLMLRKGFKHRDIQVRLGLAASSITRERRLYEQELRDRRLAPLPPAGGGERYSGAKISSADRKAVEQLYLEGFGAGKISDRTGVSRTHVLRIREKLVRRLGRKGEALPGCDADGRRIVVRDHARAIPTDNLRRLRELLLAGEPVSRAARQAVVGSCRAYRVFHELKAELAARGEELQRKPWRGKRLQSQALIVAPALPGKRWGIDRYRVLIRAGRTHEDAVRQVKADWAAHVAALPFEERIHLQIKAGAKVSKVVRLAPVMPEWTFGGVATGAL
ncbi:hypothetical protein HMF7854_04295 [Sphingomonas ginkgonis]|uniref:Uncharacterized protein n=1 Tax=Sphingomonas ginkgonis TaxID=2315330 RepID=A0A3R9YKY0_9SPHN|nr:hypothetical protein [Sphingomonas ginkgonis]RST30130.1 hypothetical protein HMF7854_04295 [Sphingomonas ginkgonis]